MSRRRWAWLALAIALAGCTGSYDRASPGPATQPVAPRPPATAAPTVPPPPGPAGHTGRLAVVTGDGALVVREADGSGEVTLVSPDPATEVGLPTWAPDASRLAWTTASARGGQIHRSRPDGRERASAPVAHPVDQLSWSPALARIAVLGARDGPTRKLSMLEVGDPRVRALYRADPLAVGWSPDASRLALRAGNEVVLASPEGDITRLGLRAAPGAVPTWLDPDRLVVAVQLGAGERRLSVVDLQARRRQDLAAFEQAITAVVDPTRRRVAAQTVPETTGGLDVIAHRGGGPLWQADGGAPLLEPGRLVVLDVAGTGLETIVDHPVAAFQWSPDGTTLAFLEPTDEERFRWRFWRDGSTVDGPAFEPSTASRAWYLDDFARHAETTRWWAPDSAAFAFAGQVGQRAGIWVVDPSDGGLSRHGTGTAVAWSPR